MDSSGVNPVPADGIVLLQDIAGIVWIFALVGVGLVLELTRRQLCSLAQTSFVFSSFTLFLICGGFLDHLVSNHQLLLWLFSPPAPFLSHFIAGPALLIYLTTSLFVSTLWFCTCTCCCVIGSKAQSHQLCRVRRIHSAARLYGLCSVVLLALLGARLNARLRHSTIHPTGGTLHWLLLQSPTMLAFVHCGAILLLWLHRFLDHIEATASTERTQHTANATTTADSERTLQELLKAKEQIQAQARTIALLQVSTQEAASSRSKAQVSRKNGTKKQTLAAALEREQGQKVRKRRPERRRPSKVNGDVSALISSDSEDDDDILEAREPLPTYRKYPKERYSAPEDTWIECYDEQNDSIYYYCEATGESRWDDPSVSLPHTKWE